MRNRPLTPSPQDLGVFPPGPRPNLDGEKILWATVFTNAPRDSPTTPVSYPTCNSSAPRRGCRYTPLPWCTCPSSSARTTPSSPGSPEPCSLRCHPPPMPSRRPPLARLAVKGKGKRKGKVAPASIPPADLRPLRARPPLPARSSVPSGTTPPLDRRRDASPSQRERCSRTLPRPRCRQRHRWSSSDLGPTTPSRGRQGSHPCPARACRLDPASPARPYRHANRRAQGLPALSACGPLRLS